MAQPHRIQIEDVSPQVNCGRHPAKRTLGGTVEVSATVFRDGHDVLGAAVRHRPKGSPAWQEAPLALLGDDRFAGGFVPDSLGLWEFQVVAWTDRIASWQDELRRRLEGGQEDLQGELAEGALLLGRETLTVEEGLAAPLGDRHDPAASAVYELDVDRERAAAGAWYELFPRSFGGFAGVAAVLPELAALGFDVVYLAPIHPIGRTNRKGRSGALVAGSGDPGSPWAIGAEEGGHTAVHPGLGTLDDFDALVAAARAHGLELALDFAIQCSPDHPWLTEHPEWFHRRPDGTIRYAENPPKRYQDIVNVDWECEDRQGLWEALRDVVLFWVARGVKVFRVDNPHTKPLPFWEWLIREVRSADEEVVFLAEAFTRPVPMLALARAGFSQSYTYFTWKNTKAELVELIEQLRSWADVYRPNFFANTPDILHAYLQRGGRPAFEARLVLAATLSPSYGIYSGFEHCENVPLEDGSEEYLDSEKYELKERRLDGPLLPLVRRLNEARRAEPSLRRLELVFLETESEHLLGYVKGDVVCVVNLDPFAAHDGAVIVPAELGLPAVFAASDLLSESRFEWRTGRNLVRLGPGQSHVLKVEV